MVRRTDKGFGIIKAVSNMNNTAKIISTSAVAALTGLGMMPSASTESILYNATCPLVEYNKPILASQTATSVVKLNIFEMHRMGEDNYIRIQEISRLKVGWDGFKAQPIPVSVISRTKELLMTLPNGAQIFPTGRRSVQIEYNKGEDNYLEIEISARSYDIYSVKDEDEFEDRVYKKDIKSRVEAFLS